MLHWTPESHELKLGINFYITKKYFRLIFIWITLPLEIKEIYFRFRFFLSPHIIYRKQNKTQIDIVNDYLFERDLYIRTREEIENEKMQGEGPQHREGQEGV